MASRISSVVTANVSVPGSNRMHLNSASMLRIDTCQQGFVS